MITQQHNSSMARISLNISEETAQRFREHALRKTKSMKGLSQIGEEALVEYLEKHRFVNVRGRAPAKDDQPPVETPAEEPAQPEHIEPTETI
jgi:hypothetical protein